MNEVKNKKIDRYNFFPIKKILHSAKLIFLTSACVVLNKDIFSANAFFC